MHRTNQSYYEYERSLTFNGSRDRPCSVVAYKKPVSEFGAIESVGDMKKPSIVRDEITNGKKNVSNNTEYGECSVRA